MAYVVSVEPDCVVISSGINGRKTVIDSVAAYHAFFDAEAARLGRSVDALAIFNSSTMDFPNDSTSNPQVLALVAALNGDTPDPAPIADPAEQERKLAFALSALASEAQKADRAYNVAGSKRLRNRNTMRGALAALRHQLDIAEGLIAQQDAAT